MANAKNTKKRTGLSYKARILILIVLAAVLAISLLFETQINRTLGLRKVESSSYKGAHTEEVLSGSGGEMKYHFVDVGQGDACIVELPDEKNILIDSGKNDSSDTLIKYIQDNVKNGEEPITYFDFVILTHADEDHCGEMSDVLNVFSAKTFYRPNQLASKAGFSDPGKDDLYGAYSSKNTAAYMKAIEAGYKGAETTYATNALDEKQNAIRPAGKQEGDEGYYSIDFYAPTKAVYSDVNDYSPIIILSFEGKKVALSGDAEKQAEADFVELAGEGNGRYARFDEAFTVQAVKLGHHGSRTSSSDAYLNAITTLENIENVIVIISCGVDNKYKHPHSEVIERLKKLGFKEENILRTDVNGTVALNVKFDEESKTYKLYAGANEVRADESALRIGSFDVNYREMIITFFIAVALVLLIQPLVKDMKKGAKKAAKAAGIDAAYTKTSAQNAGGKKSSSTAKKSSTKKSTSTKKK